MILIWKSDGLVNETARFLGNPGPEASEPGTGAALPILPATCAPSATRRPVSPIVLPIPKTDVSDLT